VYNQMKILGIAPSIPCYVPVELLGPKTPQFSNADPRITPSVQAGLTPRNCL